MTTTITSAEAVPLPAGAVRVYEWEPPEVSGYEQPSRFFVGTDRKFALYRSRKTRISPVFGRFVGFRARVGAGRGVSGVWFCFSFSPHRLEQVAAVSGNPSAV
jgi:hypothetical protein